MPEIHRSVQRLLANKNHSGIDGTPPSDGHYKDLYLWDSCFHSIVYAAFHHPDEATAEIRAILLGQDSATGFVPNMHVRNGNARFRHKTKRFLDPERRTFKTPDIQSDYTQPPLLAMAALLTYQSYQDANREEEGREFLSTTFDQIEKSYQYFMRYRRDGVKSRLVNVMHPHETGRDSAIEFDELVKKRLERRNVFAIGHLIDKANTIFDYASALNINRKLQQAGWDIEKARDIFWVQDIMFNCLYSQNLSYLSEIAGILEKQDEMTSYRQLSEAVGYEITTSLWDPKDNKFYAKSKNEFIRVVSVSNLFPIILPGIPTEQVKTLLDAFEDPMQFNRPFPVPTVPFSSPKYDPSFREKRIWRGPTWINMNYLLVKGLIDQRNRFAKSNPEIAKRCNTIALNIVQKSIELVEKEGYREFYNPETGKGLRTKNFGWSTLADIMNLSLDDLTNFTLSETRDSFS